MDEAKRQKRGEASPIPTGYTRCETCPAQRGFGGLVGRQRSSSYMYNGDSIPHAPIQSSHVIVFTRCFTARPLLWRHRSALDYAEEVGVHMQHGLTRGVKHAIDRGKILLRHTVLRTFGLIRSTNPGSKVQGWSQPRRTEPASSGRLRTPQGSRSDRTSSGSCPI